MADDIRDVVEKAFEGIEPESPEVVDGVSDGAEEVHAADAGTDAGVGDTGDAGELKPADAAAAPTVAEGAQVDDAPKTFDTPPTSWRKEEKAQWGKVPAEVRGMILERERNAANMATELGNARKMLKGVGDLLSPHQQMFERTKTAPLTAVKETLELAEVLNGNDSSNKVRVIGHLINAFGVDVEALDKYLVDPRNAPKPQQAQQPQAPSYDPTQDARLSPLFNFAKVIQDRQSSAMDREIETARKWPGFEDAALEIADFVEWSGQRGQNVSLAQAYARVVGKPAPVASAPAKGAANPTVSQAAAILAKSRKAAASVAGDKKIAPEVDSDDLRTTIVAAANGLL